MLVRENPAGTRQAMLQPCCQVALRPNRQGDVRLSQAAAGIRGPGQWIVHPQEADCRANAHNHHGLARKGMSFGAEGRWS